MTLIKQNIPLASKTSFRVGGVAQFFAGPQSEADIAEAIFWARDRDIPVFTLGGGSNILISDLGWRGLVLDLSGFSEIKRNKDFIECRSGTLAHDLVIEMANSGLSGIEDLAGIPGSIGGAVVMNAGAFGQNISDCLSWVTGIDLKTGTTWKKTKEEIDFGYRWSSLKDCDQLIVHVAFSFKKGTKGEVKARCREILNKRKEKQPLGFPNCGSVFKRPKGEYAGNLIEKAGLKGARVGGVVVSEKHANFFQNIANATARDVRELVVMVQKAVHKESGILLEPELIFVGEFGLPLFNPEEGSQPKKKF
ncbi:MAG: UDP-N-acetylmuramate dehydrogenase [Nitrospinota bacterium]